MTTKQLAKKIGVTADTIRRWIKLKKLKECSRRSKIGYRDFSEKDLLAAKKVFEQLHPRKGEKK